MRRLACCAVLLTAVGLGACGEGGSNDCACTVSIGAETLQLGCGESGCLSGSRFGCDEDNVLSLGRCTVIDQGDNGDGGDGGQCLPLQEPCTGSMRACCGLDRDGGALAPACDPISQRCCVPDGAPCQLGTDCCNGARCESTGSEPHCAR